MRAGNIPGARIRDFNIGTLTPSSSPTWSNDHTEGGQLVLEFEGFHTRCLQRGLFRAVFFRASEGSPPACRGRSSGAGGGRARGDEEGPSRRGSTHATCSPRVKLSCLKRQNTRVSARGTGPPGSISTKQAWIAKIAREHPKEALTPLSHHIDLDWLREAHRRTRRNAAPGVDRQTATCGR